MYNDLMQSILTLPQNIIEFVSYSTEKLPSNSILHFFALFNKRKGIHSERLLFLYPKFTVKGANKMEKQKKSYVKLSSRSITLVLLRAKNMALLETEIKENRPITTHPIKNKRR